MCECVGSRGQMWGLKEGESVCLREKREHDTGGICY